MRKFVENCLDRVGMDYHKMRLEGRGVSEGSYSLGLCGLKRTELCVLRNLLSTVRAESISQSHSLVFRRKTRERKGRLRIIARSIQPNERVASLGLAERVILN